MKHIALITVFILSACGFSPVYSPSLQSGEVQNAMASVSIAVIPNKEGVSVRNHLIDRINKGGYSINPEYNLIVSPIQENIVEIGIDKDDEASRAQLRESANMRLVRLSDDKTVLTRTIRTVSSYNILSGQFTTYVTEEDARQQALRALADNIVTELELYFRR